MGLTGVRSSVYGMWSGRKAVAPQRPVHLNNWIVEGSEVNQLEFDPGSGRTLAVRLMHASRTAPVRLVGQG